MSDEENRIKGKMALLDTVIDTVIERLLESTENRIFEGENSEIYQSVMRGAVSLVAAHQLKITEQSPNGMSAPQAFHMYCKSIIDFMVSNGVKFCEEDSQKASPMDILSFLFAWCLAEEGCINIVNANDICETQEEAEDLKKMLESLGMSSKSFTIN